MPAEIAVRYSARPRARTHRGSTSCDATLSVERQNSQPTPATTQNATAGARYGATASSTRASATSPLPTANTQSALRCSRTRGTRPAVATAPRPMPAYRMPKPPEPQSRSALA